MADLRLDLDYPEAPDAWRPPPVTRWCLVGEPGRPLYRITETGQPGDPEAGIAPPVKADHEWLARDAVGTTTTWGDGIAGYVRALIVHEADAERRASHRWALRR